MSGWNGRKNLEGKMTYVEIINKWNSTADEYNQWDHSRKKKRLNLPLIAGEKKG